jgi:Luciferase
VGFAAEIEEVVGSWDGVTAEGHRFGGIEFRVGKRELGHLHKDHLADFPFTMKLRDDLIEAGRVDRHHVLPETGWASRRIRDENDVADVIALFRLQYERATAGSRASD